jgi:DNA repair photolyase
MALQISDELARTIEKAAEAKGKTVEDFLISIMRRERMLAERKKIEAEQEWRANLSLTERAKYEGEYVAIHNRKLVDHDKNGNELYFRVREKYGKTPVLIMPSEGPREIHVSP